MVACSPPLEPIARNTVNVAKIATQWPDMLRVAGSLVTSQVRACDLLQMSGRDGHPTLLGQAFIEYGRIARTLHLLALVDPVDGSCQPPAELRPLRDPNARDGEDDGEF